MAMSRAWVRRVISAAVILGAAVVVADAARPTFTLGVVEPAPGTRTVLAAVVGTGEGGASGSTSAAAAGDGALRDPDVTDAADDVPEDAEAPVGPDDADLQDVEVTVDVLADGTVMLVVCGGLTEDGELVVRIGPDGAPIAVVATATSGCRSVTLDLPPADEPVVLHVNVPTPSGSTAIEVTVPEDVPDTGDPQG